MKILKKSISIFIFLCFCKSVSQQLPQFTQYMFNTISINPAYAGSREALNVVILHRSQWVGFDGAPTTQTLSVHSPLKDPRVGIGFSAINDNLGAEHFTYLYGDFSYSLQIGPLTKLALGLKGGFTYHSLNNDFLNDPSVINDPYFNQYSNRWTPNVGVGAFLHASRWYMGISAPRIFKNDYNKSRDDQAAYAAFERVGYYLTGGYVFNLNDTVKFKPSVVLKATNGAPLSFDATALFLFNEKLWLGTAYRIDSFNTFGAIIDFQLSDMLRLGYAYELPVSGIRPYTSGTHEVLLILEFKNRRRIKSPRYF